MYYTSNSFTTLLNKLKVNVLYAPQNLHVYISGVSGHTHSLFCHDIAVGCKFDANFCVIPEYKDWASTNCRKTCNYC
jgi:hypothetical protein